MLSRKYFHELKKLPGPLDLDVAAQCWQLPKNTSVAGQHERILQPGTQLELLASGGWGVGANVRSEPALLSPTVRVTTVHLSRQ